MAKLRASRLFLRLVWLDLLCLTLVSLVMGALYLVPINRRNYRVFPVWRDSDGSLRGPAYISYPYVPQIITSPVAAAVCLTVPIAIVALFQVRLRSVWDMHAATFGLLRALILVLVLL